MRRRGIVSFPQHRRVDEGEILHPEAWEASLPGDVRAAFNHLRKRQLETARVIWAARPTPIHRFGVVAPIVMRHHLYGLIADRSEVDKDIEALRRSDVVRLIRVTDNEVGILLASDYANLINEVAKSNESGMSALLHVATNCSSVSLTLDMLTGFILAGGDLASKRTKTSTMSQLSVAHVIDAVVLSGFLTISNPSSAGSVYHFSVPHLGVYIESLLGGRHELVMAVKRTRRKELSRRDLLKRTLRKTVYLSLLGLYLVFGGESP
jgi:hypothetical protein